MEEKTTSHQKQRRRTVTQHHPGLNMKLYTQYRGNGRPWPVAITLASPWKTVNRDGMSRTASPTSRNCVHNSVCCPNPIHPMTRLRWGKDGEGRGPARRNSGSAPE